MGKLRIRRKRRRDIRKPDAAIVILSVMLVALLFLWGGLYWNESSKGNLAVQAYEGELAEFAYPEDESLDSLDQAEPAASEDSTEDGQSAAAGEEPPPSSSAPDGEAVAIPSASSGIGNAPGGEESAKSKAAGSDKPGATAGGNPSATGSEKPGATAGGNPSATGSEKPDATGSDNPSATGSEKPDATGGDNPSATTGEKPGAAGGDKPNEEGTDEPKEPATEPPNDMDTESSSANPEETAVSRTLKYEQEIAEVQAACTRKMREVTSGAESAFQQLNILDPVAVQAWQVGFANELEDAESDCDGQFRAIVQSAESDFESSAAIEEWQRTFVSMKQELKAESNAKAKQLMGG